MASLTEEIDAAVASKNKAEKEALARRQEQSIKDMREGFKYVFGEAPDDVVPYGREQAVALKDGLRFVYAYTGESRPNGGLHVLCTCKHCGNDFVSWETMGPTKNHYSSLRETSAEEKRARAVSNLAKLTRRDFQPNGHDYDHVCYAGAVESVRSRVYSAAKATGLSTFEIIQRVSLSL